MDSAQDPVPVLGLRQRIVRLRRYTPQWAALFDVEAQAIRSVLGTLALDVQHVGSTAIPGMTSKPILDIAVGVEQMDDFRHCIAPLAQLGYEHAHWAGLQQNEVFGKGLERTHLIHMVIRGGEKWNEYIRFRDYLRNNPLAAKEYEELKISLSLSHAEDRAAYTDAKNVFIRRILDAA